MASEWARQKAAQAWCEKTTSHIEMDVDLAEAFADILDALAAAPAPTPGLVKGMDWNKAIKLAREARDSFGVTYGGDQWKGIQLPWDGDWIGDVARAVEKGYEQGKADAGPLPEPNGA